MVQSISQSQVPTPMYSRTSNPLEWLQLSQEEPEFLERFLKGFNREKSDEIRNAISTQAINRVDAHWFRLGTEHSPPLTLGHPCTLATLLESVANQKIQALKELASPLRTSGLRLPQHNSIENPLHQYQDWHSFLEEAYAQQPLDFLLQIEVPKTILAEHGKLIVERVRQDFSQSTVLNLFLPIFTDQQLQWLIQAKEKVNHSFRLVLSGDSLDPKLIDQLKAHFTPEDLEIIY